jgi:hypothetical protein
MPARGCFGIAVIWLMGVSAALAATCSETGLYEGHAKAGNGPTVEVPLNLYCAGGRYGAQFFTSDGDFDGKAVAIDKGHLVTSFDTGVPIGGIDLVRKGDLLSGTLLLGEEKGSANLKRMGEALAADGMTPRLDLTAEQWRQDLHTLAMKLPQVHANAFFSLSKKEFYGEIAALDRRIATANADEIYVGLKQIEAASWLL